MGGAPRRVLQRAGEGAPGDAQARLEVPVVAADSQNLFPVGVVFVPARELPMAFPNAPPVLGMAVSFDDAFRRDVSHLYSPNKDFRRGA